MLQRTSAALDLNQREFRIFSYRKRPRQRAIISWVEHCLEVAHKVSRHVKGSWHAAIENVLFNVGFAIEVKYVWKSTVACLGDVQERREYEVLNPNFLGYIGNVLALSNLGGRVRSLPVVGD